MNQQMIVPLQNDKALASLEKLESRIHSAIDLLRFVHHEEPSTKLEDAQVKQRLIEKERALECVEVELKELQSERKQVRQRVQSLMKQIENLA